MRQGFDFSPLFGSTVGFDRVFDLLQSATRGDQDGDKFPRYDIERVGKNGYRIVLAVAGFSRDEPTLTAEGNLLAIEGKRAADDPAAAHREVLHRGIGAGAFKQTFQLADHVKVTSANLADGLLTVDLVRETPEMMSAADRGRGRRSSNRSARTAARLILAPF